MKNKRELLKDLVEKEGTAAMKKFMVVVEAYLRGLDHIFKDREVDRLILEKFDLPLFVKELEEYVTLDYSDPFQAKMFLMDIVCTARHIWEFTDERGVKKTGDDLHREFSIIYEGDEAMSAEDFFHQNMKYFNLDKIIFKEIDKKNFIQKIFENFFKKIFN